MFRRAHVGGIVFFFFISFGRQRTTTPLPLPLFPSPRFPSRIDDARQQEKSAARLTDNMGKAKKTQQDAAPVDEDDAVFQQRALELKGSCVIIEKKN